MTFGSLFAGIGGFDLGLERAGMVCKWQVEIDPYARAVLNKHWPEVPKHDDVRTFPPQGEWGVDVIRGGFPCQDISVAGKGAGLAGARSGLWYEYARIIGELRPRYVIVENVAALLTRGADVVLGTLASLGYDAEWHVIPASAVGAPHRRDRLWIIAFRNSDSEREADVPDAFSVADAMQRDGAAGSPAMAGRRLHAGGGQCNRWPGCAGQAGKGACDVADADKPRLEGRDGPTDVELHGGPGQVRPTGAGRVQGWDGGGWWSVEPEVGRVAHGVPARVDRLRCLGNAVGKFKSTFYYIYCIINTNFITIEYIFFCKLPPILYYVFCKKVCYICFISFIPIVVDVKEVKLLHCQTMPSLLNTFIEPEQVLGKDIKIGDILVLYDVIFQDSPYLDRKVKTINFIGECKTTVTKSKVLIGFDTVLLPILIDSDALCLVKRCPTP